MTKYVICYSGGHSSAICAIEAVRKHGKENVILLNHDISSLVEDADIKRFKQEVAEYLGLPITQANHANFEEMTPVKVCKDLGIWKRGQGQIICTYNLKTKPFYDWLKINDPNRIYIYIYMDLTHQKRNWHARKDGRKLWGLRDIRLNIL